MKGNARPHFSPAKIVTGLAIPCGERYDSAPNHFARELSQTMGPMTHRYPRTGIPNRTEFRCRECGYVYLIADRSSSDRKKHPLAYRTCQSCHFKVWGTREPKM